MDQYSIRYQEIVNRFVAWAQTQPDIRAALVIGSRARAERPPDEWSDLDLVFVAVDPNRYLGSTDWLDNLGRYWFTFLERTATGHGTERRVLFEGGVDVDFIPISTEDFARMISREVPPEVDRVVSRGFRTILDKDQAVRFKDPPPTSPPTQQPPTQDEFRQLVFDFLYHALWTTKKLNRGELWVAKLCLDCYMKRRLLTMMENHAQAAHGLSFDTWHDGRFLEEWADPRIVSALQNAFAHYREDDVVRALFATMNVFRLLAVETAERLRYAYPTSVDEQVTKWIQTNLGGRLQH